MSHSVTIVEVGPRDGLQNEPGFVPTKDKVALVNQLSACGFARIETTSFVSSRWVPQMADAREVMQRISRKAGVIYSVLTPNLKGLEAALEAEADEVAVFASASESFSKKNINCSIAESRERFGPLTEAARKAGVPVRGYVSCIVECPYEGAVAPDAVARVTKDLLALGCYEVSLGDTLGRGQAGQIATMLDAVLDVASASQLAGHYHDTNGQAEANIAVSLDKGIRVFDSAIAGLGGCPFAPGAKGNVDTRKVHAQLERLGYHTGLDADQLRIAERLAHHLRS
ncbi:hydroxymethylglutaryl-CoA lyase [Rhizobium halophilum]|uniref:hydroxymethylglutaryl-CoA lyase n=1 Tax=Rhizobium halophilum TaxID=2846852 RepID=UPI001EFD250C|nr:hydroxymethylglutaryl-CoA lyase [Rhizobium halophilum]MCF6371035.1 hydroxymethylglutaryl-CoA lyase [Rhizobium halophilum]